MAVRLAIQRRLHLDDAPPQVSTPRRLPPVVLLAVLHWGALGALTWGVATGRVPLGQFLDGMTRVTRNQETPADPVPAPRRSGAPTRPPRSRGVSIALSSAPAESAAPTASIDEPRLSSSEHGPRLVLRDPAARAARTVSEPPPQVASSRNAPPLGAPSSPTVHRSPLHVASPSLPSCEAARVSHADVIDPTAGARPPDLPRSALSAVLDDGAMLGACGVPETTAVDLCVAVQHGRVVGVTVQADPPSARVEACVAAGAARLGFPSSPHLDVARTRYDALRRP